LRPRRAVRLVLSESDPGHKERGEKNSGSKGARGCSAH
jgi:hypothetical protein